MYANMKRKLKTNETIHSWGDFNMCCTNADQFQLRSIRFHFWLSGYKLKSHLMECLHCVSIACCVVHSTRFCKHQVSGECLRWRCMFVGLSTVRGQLLHNSRYPSICSACPCVRMMIEAALSQHIYDWWWNRIYIYILFQCCLPARRCQ